MSWGPLLPLLYSSYYYEIAGELVGLDRSSAVLRGTNIRLVNKGRQLQTLAVDQSPSTITPPAAVMMDETMEKIIVA